MLDEAVDYQLVTHDLDELRRPTNIQLTPEVAYSLGLIDNLPPPPCATSEVERAETQPPMSPFALTDPG